MSTTKGENREFDEAVRAAIDDARKQAAPYLARVTRFYETLESARADTPNAELTPRVKVADTSIVTATTAVPGLYAVPEVTIADFVDHMSAVVIEVDSNTAIPLASFTDLRRHLSRKLAASSEEAPMAATNPVIVFSFTSASREVAIMADAETGEVFVKVVTEDE